MHPTSKLILPEPTYKLPDKTKKSHARKKPEGHIPRPRNAFILFRCDFVRQKKIPELVETDHRNISRIVGRIWRGMTAMEKDPWVQMAEAENANHLKAYPGYRFARGSPSGKRKTKSTEGVIPHTGDNERILLALERATSCPPGALHIPAANLEASNGYEGPLKVRDNLERRPSRITLYQTTPHDEQDDPDLFTLKNIDQQYFADASKYKYSKATATEPRAKKYAKDDDSSKTAFRVPRLSATMHYPIPDIDVPPEWENNSPAGMWQGWRKNSDYILGGPTNDIDNYHSSPRNSPPEFTNPFAMSSTLPPLPRCDLPFAFEEDLGSAVALSNRTESRLFSPRT